jgi:uncharacterized protein (TIGR02145 family)
MRYRQILLLLAILLTCAEVESQNIDVKSFKVLQNDQTARAYNPVIDQNGEKCALIKVVTTEKGFVWEGGALGITEVKKKTGEYWVYVPHGSKKITIKHDKLGVLRNYVYPVAIKEATVYEMELTTGEVKTVVEEEKIAAQWLAIQTKPEEASVFIDGKLAGTTPFQRKYEEGEYTYRIEKSRFHNKAGKVTLEDEKESLKINLKPKFGNIKVTSVPEDGMEIYLDDNNTGKNTPATLEEISSGEHTIKLQSRWYQPQTKKVTVKDEQTTNVDFELERAFANITVKAQPSANIFVDGEQKGNGKWQGRLMEGIYTIKADKEKYYSQSEQLEVTAGQDETVNFDLKGKTGNADVVSTPIKAEVYLDGEKQGTTPLTLSDLMIGEYNLKIKKEDYGTVTETLTIQEDETVTIEEQLPDAKKITISSKPTGADVYIDGNHVGGTPYEGELGFGRRKVKLVNGKTVIKEVININQNNKSEWNFDVSEFLIDERDGKKYEIVKIGDQTWMAENLAYKTEEGFCRAYAGRNRNIEKYGYLYDWDAAMEACPDGWHLPSKKEFKELLRNYSIWGSERYESLIEGGKSGFDAKLGGFYCDLYGCIGDPECESSEFMCDFYDIEKEGKYWTSTKSLGEMKRLSFDESASSTKMITSDGDLGFSVRCVKDD